MQEITKPDPKKFGTRTRTVLSQHPYKLDTNVHQSIHQKRHWKLNRRRVTRSVVHSALLLRGRQDERALILFNLRLASYSAAAWKKKGAHAACTKCDTSSARTLEELGSDENDGQEKSSSKRSVHRGREWVLLASLLQVGSCRGAANLHPLAVRIDRGTLRKKMVLSHMTTQILQETNTSTR